MLEGRKETKREGTAEREREGIQAEARERWGGRGGEGRAGWRWQTSSGQSNLAAAEGSLPAWQQGSGPSVGPSTGWWQLGQAFGGLC